MIAEREKSELEVCQFDLSLTLLDTGKKSSEKRNEEQKKNTCAHTGRRTIQKQNEHKLTEIDLFFVSFKA